MASLASQLEQRRQEKESFWLSKRLKLQALEATQEQTKQKERERLLSQHKQAFIRLQNIEKERETDINQRTAIENAKYHRSKRRKSRLDQLNAQRASADFDEYLLAEQKSVEIRQNRAENMRKTGELREMYRESRRNEAERVKRMADFRRKQTLERITEDDEHIRRLKRQKDQELLLKQQLRKQLETQKQLITERFEHLEMVKGPRLVRSLNPSARQAISVH
jgi:ribulose bisphosphate carboxylase small subunit